MPPLIAEASWARFCRGRRRRKLLRIHDERPVRVGRRHPFHPVGEHRRLCPLLWLLASWGIR